MKLIITVLDFCCLANSFRVEKVVNESTPPTVSAAYCNFKQWLEKKKERGKKTSLYVQITSHKTKHTAHRKVQEFKKEIRIH